MLQDTCRYSHVAEHSSTHGSSLSHTTGSQLVSLRKQLRNATGSGFQIRSNAPMDLISNLWKIVCLVNSNQTSGIIPICSRDQHLQVCYMHSSQDYSLITRHCGYVWGGESTQTHGCVQRPAAGDFLDLRSEFGWGQRCSWTRCWWSWRTWRPGSLVTPCSGGTSTCCCLRWWCSALHWASGSPSTVSLPRGATFSTGERALCSRVQSGPMASLCHWVLSACLFVSLF